MPVKLQQAISFCHGDDDPHNGEHTLSIGAFIFTAITSIFIEYLLNFKLKRHIGENQLIKWIGDLREESKIAGEI